MAHENVFTFVKVGSPYANDLYWLDINGDGRQAQDEYIRIEDNGQWDNNATQFIQNEKRLAPLPENWKYNRLESYKEYFSHPEKSTFELQLIIDITRLEAMKSRPEIYTELLQDLRQMKDELQYTRFQYVESSDLPEEVLATYESRTSTVYTLRNPPTAVLIHELDHALTYHRRTNLKAIEIYPTVDASIVNSFTFYLDYPLKEDSNEKTISLYFDLTASFEPYLTSPDPQHPLCLTQSNIDANLANEVHAFQVMSRYWLYQMGVTEAELKTIQEGGSAKREFLKSLEERIRKLILGTNTSPQEAYQILLYYFDEGGFWSNKDLRDFVKNAYTELGDPGFVDEPECIKRASQRTSGCGCSMCR